MTAIIREHKTLLIVFAVGIFLLELEIFAMAAMKSGRKSWLQVIDQKGNLIHETDGGNLSSFDKYYFEKTFGPFDQYEVKLITRDRPFPFRAWFAAAVGIPLGAILLLAFLVQAFQALFYRGGRSRTDENQARGSEPETRLEKMIARLTRFNIFTIGFLIFLAVLSYWVVPNIVSHLGKAGLQTLTRYKWVFIPVGAVFTALVAWVIYLRYLLAKKTIESQMEVNKHRLQLELNAGRTTPLELDYSPQEKNGSTELKEKNEPIIEATIVNNG